MFRLCLALGVVHPDHLRHVLSARQVAGWMAYATIEPFGELQADYRAGVVASITANSTRSSRAQKSYQPGDFFPWLEGEERRQKSPQELYAEIREWAASFSVKG